MPEIIQQNPGQFALIAAIVGGLVWNNWGSLKAWWAKRQNKPATPPEPDVPNEDPQELVEAFTFLRGVLAECGEDAAVKALENDVWSAVGRAIGAVADEPAE